jgi:hypothetical protein
MICAAEAPPLNDNDGAGPEEPAGGDAQRVFVRIIIARAGAPWDQSRQAALEARLGAPARAADIAWRVKRLDAWRPGALARFAAVYARSEDARAGLTATPLVDGRPLSVSFAAPAEQARRLSGVALAALACGAAAACLMALAGQVMTRRTTLTNQLENVERTSSARLRQAEDLARMKRQATVLDQERLEGRRISDVLADLTWASLAKSPAAHIQALHWDHRFMAVEVQGDALPFTDSDRPVQRSKAQIRPGVWLWGVVSLEPWDSENPPQRRRR